ncbi:MAG: serine hydrolase domain-containing protein [Thermomicrobiales bacterium]
MSTKRTPTAPRRLASTRRTLLKSAAVAAAAGATMPWLPDPAGATPASLATGSIQTERRYQTNGGGLSATRLERMHEIMAGHVERGAAPGLVTVVSRRGEIHVDAIGMTEVDGSDPMRRDTIFRIASVTKPIVAAAAMILVEETVLRLDDPVDALLPELADRQVLRSLDSEPDDTVPANRPITLRDLLTFRLGYGLIFAPPDTYPIQQVMDESGVFPNVAAGGIMPTLPPDELMQGYGNLPLLHQPGEQYFYNSGSDILGVLIARATDMSLGEFLQERLFTPLGMKDSGFSVPGDKLDRLPTSYFTNPETGTLEVFDGVEDSRWASPPPFESGGGGLVSTADDLLTFGEMMLNNGAYGDERILSRPSVTLMTTDHITPEQKAASPFFPASWENRGWGFGVAIDTRRDNLWQTPGRYGWFGGYGTSWDVDPAEEMITILLTQSVDILFTGGLQDFWTSAYAAIDD